MPPEPTKPIEPEISQESEEVRPLPSLPLSKGEVPEAEGVSEPVSEPIVETPVSEPIIVSVPIPASEPVVLPEPVVVPTESTPEPIVETPVSEPVFSPPAKGESEGVSQSQTPPVPLSGEANPEPTPAPTPQLDSFHINMARARELLVKARYAIQLNKKKKMDKIMGLFDKHAPTHIRNRIGVGEVKVTNREVRDLLRLSHDMVNVYMNVLIKEGKIKKEGKGTATHYTKV